MDVRYVQSAVASPAPIFEIVELTTGMGCGAPAFTFSVVDSAGRPVEMFGPQPGCRDCGTVPCGQHGRRTWPLQDPEPAAAAAANGPVGWRCPSCGACWAPWIRQCGSLSCRPAHVVRFDVP